MQDLISLTVSQLTLLGKFMCAIRIRKITPDGIVSTFAGNGKAGTLDGIGTNAQLSQLIKMDQFMFLSGIVL